MIFTKSISKGGGSSQGKLRSRGSLSEYTHLGYLIYSWILRGACLERTPSAVEVVGEMLRMTNGEEFLALGFSRRAVSLKCLPIILQFYRKQLKRQHNKPVIVKMINKITSKLVELGI